MLLVATRICRSTLEENEKSIHEAREAYDALTDEEKSYVTKLDMLQKAETEYAQLLQDIADRKAVDEVVKQIRDAFNLVEQAKVMTGSAEPDRTDVSNDSDEMERQEMSGSGAEAESGTEGETGTETGTVSGNAVPGRNGNGRTVESPDVTLADAVMATRDARLAYESLTPHQRELVREQNILLAYESENAGEIKEEYPADTLLVMTEEELARLLGAKAAVEEAEGLIEALPEVDALTVEDVPSVRKAAAVYEAAVKVLSENPDETVKPDEKLADKLDQAVARAKLLPMPIKLTAC